MSSLQKKSKMFVNIPATASNFQNPLSFNQLVFRNEEGEQEGILSHVNHRNMIMQFSDQEQKNIHQTVIQWASSFVNSNIDPTYEDLQSFIKGFKKPFYTPLFFEALVILGNYFKKKYPEVTSFDLISERTFNATDTKTINFLLKHEDGSTIELRDFTFEYLKITSSGFSSSIPLVLYPYELSKEEYFKHHFFPNNYNVSLDDEKNLDPSNLLVNYFLEDKDISDVQKYDALLDMKAALLPGKTNHTALARYIDSQQLQDFLVLLDETISKYKEKAINAQNNKFRSCYPELKNLPAEAEIEQNLVDAQINLEKCNQKGQLLNDQANQLMAQISFIQKQLKELKMHLENISIQDVENKTEQFNNNQNINALKKQITALEVQKQTIAGINDFRKLNRENSLTEKERKLIKNGNNKLSDVLKERNKQNKIKTTVTYTMETINIPTQPTQPQNNSGMTALPRQFETDLTQVNPNFNKSNKLN